MKKQITNYIAEKIFSIAFIIMPKSEIKANLSIWYIQTYGGNK
jgi:hypothetical protein